MSLIPFAPPRIDDEIINEVVATLKSGWITTGPRTKQFEKNLSAYNGNASTLCLNSATAGLEIMLRWFGVKEGDEVILPAYTLLLQMLWFIVERLRFWLIRMPMILTLM
jgi:dTDP-4-amino-4,6-dideoxygalactose transaminase